MSRERENHHTIFSMTNLVIALVSFVVFLVLGIWAYYGMVKPYLTVMIWTVTVVLAAVGAVAMFLHWYPFAILYYTGCVVGWFAGQGVRQLQGDEFTSNLWKVLIFVVIAVFAALGGILQWKALKRKIERKKEAKAKAQAEADKVSAELEEARKEREAAEAALAAAAIDVPAPAETPAQPFPTAPAEESPAAAVPQEEMPTFVPPQEVPTDFSFADPVPPETVIPETAAPETAAPVGESYAAEEVDFGSDFHPGQEEKKGPFGRLFGKKD